MHTAKIFQYYKYTLHFEKFSPEHLLQYTDYVCFSNILTFFNKEILYLFGFYGNYYDICIVVQCAAELHHN